MAIKHLKPVPDFKIRYFEIKDKCVQIRKSHIRRRVFSGFGGFGLSHFNNVRASQEIF